MSDCIKRGQWVAIPLSKYSDETKNYKVTYAGDLVSVIRTNEYAINDILIALDESMRIGYMKGLDDTRKSVMAVL